MMKPVRFHPEAEAELIADFDYYEARRKGLGGAFQEAVRRVVERIKSNPDRFPLGRVAGVRGCRVQRFPYTIYYQELQTEIWVVAIAHQKRKPGYWSKRKPLRE